MGIFDGLFGTSEEDLQAAIAAEDGKKILEDCQKCMTLTTKIMSAPWPPRAGGGT